MENGDKIISKNVISGVGAVNTFAKMVKGSSLKNISNSPANDSSPIYSNDGKYISFLSDRDDNLEIYVFSISDKELINISNNIRGDFNQQFIPVNN